MAQHHKSSVNQLKHFLLIQDAKEITPLLLQKLNYYFSCILKKQESVSAHLQYLLGWCVTTYIIITLHID